MKVYFEDGFIQPYENEWDYVVDAAAGYHRNEEDLNYIKLHRPDATVYTNSLVAMSNFYCWNDELQVSELYLRSSKTGGFARVDELTGSVPRPRQNLLAMYRSGMLAEQS